MFWILLIAFRTKQSQKHFLEKIQCRWKRRITRAQKKREREHFLFSNVSGRPITFVILKSALILCFSLRLFLCNFLEGMWNKNKCLVSNFYNVLNFPAFFPCETGGRKARKISSCCKNCSQGSYSYSTFP